MAKSRVSPEKETKVDVSGSTPRLELQAAVIAVDLVSYINEHVKLNVSRYCYHTDSTVVYFQIKSETGKFKVYVANRLNKIRLISSPSSWYHVPTDANPADIASRGAKISDVDKWRLFHNGPDYLRGPESGWPSQPERPSDAEIGILSTEETQVKESFIDSLLRRKSDFLSVKRIIALVIRFVSNLKSSLRSKGRKPESRDRTESPIVYGPLSVEEISAAEKRIIIDVQFRHFAEEIAIVSTPQSLSNKRYLSSKPSAVRALDPFVDGEGVLRVGGRLRNSEEKFESKHPIILPSNDPFTNHVIVHSHVSNAHTGLELTLANLRESYWILRGRQSVKKVLWRCFHCRRLFAKPEGQKMADLPPQRLSVAPVFTDTGIDMAGPFKVKYRRTEIKVWVILYTCLRVRAVYLDYVESIDSESFINSLQRFHSLYPAVRGFVCDQGTNFVGGNNLLLSMAQEWKNKVDAWSLNQLVKFEFIPAHSPHRGGIWERLIKSLKRILQSLMNGTVYIDQFRTLLAVAAGIINRRPLTRCSDDPNDFMPLTPMSFLCPGQRIAWKIR